MFDLKSKTRDVIERGYCVLESVYDDRECEQMRTIFTQLCADKNGFSSEQPTKSVFTRCWSGGRRWLRSLQSRLS